MSTRAGGAQRAFRVVAITGLFIWAAAGASTVSAGVWVGSWPAGRAGEFWTPARMRAAVPIEVDRSRSAARARASGRSRRASRGVEAGAARSEGFGSNFAAVPDPTATGFRIHGAIFISLGLFGYGRCSGTAVRSRNRGVVVTAGHCLHSGGKHGRWYRRPSAFVPAYRFGQRPFGVFSTRWIDTTRQWRSSGSENFDVGAMVVGRNQRGESLAEAVGGADIAWNLKANQTFDVHGYPAEAPFDGETQRVCEGTPFLGHDPNSFVAPGPLNLAVSCDVTGGASGGGWIIDGNTLNGVTDYGYFDQQSPDFGAYFGNEVARLYARAAAIR